MSVLFSRCGVLSTFCLVAVAVAGFSPQRGVAEDSLESKYLSNTKQLTNSSDYVKAGEGYFSPDGREIIFQAVPKGYPFYQIYKQKLDGAAAQLISTGRGRTTCSYFSPDAST